MIAETFFSIKSDEYSATYLDVAVEYLWNNYSSLADFASRGLEGIYYNIIVEDMLDDIDVHHFPLDVDF